jgi:hypothetical protein
MNSLDLNEPRQQFRQERIGRERDYSAYHQIPSNLPNDFYPQHISRVAQDSTREKFPHSHLDENERIHSLNSYIDSSYSAIEPETVHQQQDQQWRDRQYDDFSSTKRSSPYEGEISAQFHDRYQEHSTPSQTGAHPLSDISSIQSKSPAYQNSRAAAVDPFENYPADPQVFIHEDSVVMIAKPKDFEK